MSTTVTRIDQALFGYRDGHRLLQASRKFSSSSERVLLALTDMSGSRMIEGFEEYFSGYPIPGEDGYAFVKTWYAPEMERPGCVWSHVLALKGSDLVRVDDLQKLVPLFKRPDDIGLEAYDHSIPTPVDAVVDQASAIGLSTRERIIRALYEDADKPVIIPAVDSHEFETLILSIWSQQWPALRARFCFCTGSLSARTFTGRPFDLQVIPYKLARELQRSPGAYAQPLAAENEREDRENTKWLQIAGADLELGGPFRDFLRRYSDDLSPDRRSYFRLAEFFSFLQSCRSELGERDLSEITREIVHLFPDSSTGIVLKQGIYGPAEAHLPDLPYAPEKDRLTELARTTSWKSFDSSVLELRQRGTQFWKHAPLRGRELLVQILDTSRNPLAEEIATGLAQGIEASEACELARERSGILLALVARNPQLVANEEFWNCGVSEQIYYWILDALQSGNDGVANTSWIPFVLNSEAHYLAEAVIERFPKETVSAFILRASRGGESGEWIPNPTWRVALANRQSEMIDVLNHEEFNNSNYVLTLLAGLLDAHQRHIASRPISQWLDLARSGIDLVLQFPNAEAASFLLSIGFQYSGSESLDLVAPCFEHVHECAGDDSRDPLSYHAWKSLEREVPSLSWTKNWDKCERLRRAVIERFVRNSWPAEDFLRCVSRPTTLHSALYSCREVWRGEDFMYRIAERVLIGSLDATEPQRDIFRRSFRRNRRGELRFDL